MGASLLLCGIAIACLEHKWPLVWNWIQLNALIGCFLVNPFTQSIIVPRPYAEHQEISFTDHTALDDFVKSYQGSLWATGLNGKPCIMAATSTNNFCLPKSTVYIHRSLTRSLKKVNTHRLWIECSKIKLVLP